MKAIGPILIPLVCLAIVSASVILMWTIEPWWHRNPSPRRQVDDARDAVKLYRIHRRHPKAFEREP